MPKTPKESPAVRGLIPKIEVIIKAQIKVGIIINKSTKDLMAKLHVFSKYPDSIPRKTPTPKERKLAIKTTSIVRNPPTKSRRSEEHTSELQSRQYLVCRLLLEKTKT